MAIQTQRRGGTTSEHVNFIGANREMTVDTDKKTLVVHDGSQAGGFPLAREDLSNVAKETLIEKLSLDNVTGFDPIALIEKEKEKLKAELNQKIKTLMTEGEALFEHIKSAVIANVHERQLLEDKTPLGVVFPYTSNTPPEGFLLLNGETLGSENSDATHNDELYQLLYLFLWDNIDETHLVVSGSKGESALADWQSDKTMTLPDLRGRSIVGAGLGSGLTDRALGSIGGTETHTLTTAEMPSHSHSLGSAIPGGSGGSTNYGYEYGGCGHCYSSTNAAGGNAAHNNMPPWLALSWIIKY